MKKVPYWILMIMLMLTMGFLGSSNAEEHDIRIHTFAVPTMNNVNVRREPAGSIRGTIDKNETVYIMDTTVKRGKTWCRVILFRDGWYQAYIQADYLIPLHDLASDVIKVDGGAAHALLLREDGSCLSFGWGFQSALKATKWEDVKDIAVARYYNAALLKDGTILFSKTDIPFSTAEVLKWRNVERIFGATFEVNVGGTVTGIDAYGNPIVTSSWETYMDKPLPDNWKKLRQFSYTATMYGETTAAALTEDGTLYVMLSDPLEYREPEAAADLLRANGMRNVRQFAIGNMCLAVLTMDGRVYFYGRDEYDAKQCEDWTDITMIDACEQYVIGLRTDRSVVMAGKMESPVIEGRYEDTTYVNFSEDGQLDSWTDMVYIDASGWFILGIHADGSPDMIGSYR